MQFSITSHDGLPQPDAAIVDAGLGEANEHAAPLHELQSLSCFAKDIHGVVIGGAVGRRWGSCCELQQLWVMPEHRHMGIGGSLVRSFEAAAVKFGCTSFYLETFNFQAPAFYASLGYAVAHEHMVYPHGISKLLMVKQLPEVQSAALAQADPLRQTL